MAIVPEVPKHQSRIDAEKLLDLDATESDAKAEEEASKPVKEEPKAKPEEKVGMGTPSNTEEQYLANLRESISRFKEKGGKEATIARIQAEINSILAKRQNTDSNNE